MDNNLFEAFNNGCLRLPNQEVSFADIAWSKHPVFEGEELKHIITSKDTDGAYSYHLVRIAPNMSIGEHIHETQLETHEIIAGFGECINDGEEELYFLPFPFCIKQMLPASMIPQVICAVCV